MEETLTDEEIRVLGVLVEKELSTPDYYPMTLNALTNGCNQKSNRDPVVAYDEDEVLAALESLMRRHLVGRATGGGSRTLKYRHALAETWGLAEPERAALASLLLRGPQTVGEIRARTQRLHDFADLDAVADTLAALADREPLLTVELPLQPGMKEPRHAHLLAGVPEPEAAPSGPPVETGRSRIGTLETEVATLTQRLAELEAAFTAFKAEFE